MKNRLTHLLFIEEERYAPSHTKMKCTTLLRQNQPLFQTFTKCNFLLILCLPCSLANIFILIVVLPGLKFIVCICASYFVQYLVCSLDQRYLSQLLKGVCSLTHTPVGYQVRNYDLGRAVSWRVWGRSPFHVCLLVSSAFQQSRSSLGLQLCLSYLCLPFKVSFFPVFLRMSNNPLLLL